MSRCACIGFLRKVVSLSEGEWDSRTHGRRCWRVTSESVASLWMMRGYDENTDKLDMDDCCDLFDSDCSTSCRRFGS